MTRKTIVFSRAAVKSKVFDSQKFLSLRLDNWLFRLDTQDQMRLIQDWIGDRLVY
jgi:hypothetical protein